MIFIQRLTLTCGHLKLWGPFVTMDNEKMIGDHVSCDVCPRAGRQGLKQFHLVVKAEAVDEKDCSSAWIQTGLL